MIAQPEFGRPVERRDEVTCDHSGCHPILPHGPSWVGKGNPSLFYRQTGDRPLMNLYHGSLKEVQEEDVLQRIFYHLEGYPCVRGDALHEGPLLLEGLLQA